MHAVSGRDFLLRFQGPFFCKAVKRLYVLRLDTPALVEKYKTIPSLARPRNCRSQFKEKFPLHAASMIICHAAAVKTLLNSQIDRVNQFQTHKKEAHLRFNLAV